MSLEQIGILSYLILAVVLGAISALVPMPKLKIQAIYFIQIIRFMLICGILKSAIDANSAIELSLHIFRDYPIAFQLIAAKTELILLLLVDLGVLFLIVFERDNDEYAKFSGSFFYLCLSAFSLFLIGKNLVIVSATMFSIGIISFFQIKFSALRTAWEIYGERTSKNIFLLFAILSLMIGFWSFLEFGQFDLTPKPVVGGSGNHWWLLCSIYVFNLFFLVSPTYAKVLQLAHEKTKFLFFVMLTFVQYKLIKEYLICYSALEAVPQWITLFLGILGIVVAVFRGYFYESLTASLGIFPLIFSSWLMVSLAVAKDSIAPGLVYLSIAMPTMGLVSFWLLRVKADTPLRRAFLLLFFINGLGFPGTPNFYALAEITERGIAFGGGLIFLVAMGAFLSLTLYTVLLRKIASRTGLDIVNDSGIEEEFEDKFLIIPFLLILAAVLCSYIQMTGSI